MTGTVIALNTRFDEVRQELNRFESAIKELEAQADLHHASLMSVLLGLRRDQ